MNWSLSAAFPLEKLNRHLDETNDNEHDEKTTNSLIRAFGNEKGCWRNYGETVKITERNSEYTSQTLPMRFDENTDGIYSFNATLFLLSFRGTYSVTRPCHCASEEVRKNNYVLNAYAVSVGDLLKMCHYVSAANERCTDAQKTVSNENDGFLERRNAAQFAKKKTEIVKAALLHNCDDKRAGIIGQLLQTGICCIPGYDVRVRNSDRASFFETQLVLGWRVTEKRVYDRSKRCWVGLSPQEQRARFGNQLVKSACTVADTLVNYFHFGKPLYVEAQKTLQFDDPISMLEFFWLIDENECREKTKMGHYIFKKCSAREKEMLDKQEEMVVNAESVPDDIPAFMYRKFRFSSFSQTMAKTLCFSALSAVDTWKVRKRWKNQKERCVREEWRYKCSERDHQRERGARKQKLDSFNALKQEGMDLVYGEGLEAVCSLPEENDQGECKNCSIEYVMPNTILASDNSIEAEACCFLTDEEVLQRCVEIDESSSMSLGEKLDELNHLAYSRVGPEDTGYLLLCSKKQEQEEDGNDECVDASEDSGNTIYRTVFVPHTDLRLPKIVVVKLSR